MVIIGNFTGTTSYSIKNSQIPADELIQWEPNGVRAYMGAWIDAHKYSRISSDGQGGVFLVWKHNWENKIMGQHINSDGENQWDADTSIIAADYGERSVPTICSDGQNGAIIVWHDERNGYYENYAQRVNAIGEKQWVENGIPISPNSNRQYSPNICSDGQGGAIIIWFDERSNGDRITIYSQIININGELLWTREGIPISGIVDPWNADLQVFSDGQGGAIVVWQNRVSFSSYSIHEIYAQKINMNGEIQWANRAFIYANKVLLYSILKFALIMRVEFLLHGQIQNLIILIGSYKE